MTFEYYYQHMHKEEQNIYRILLQGLNQLEDEILIPKIDMQRLGELFLYMRLDHPEVFWAVDFRCKYYQDSPNLIFVPEYIFKKAKIKDHQKAMQARIEKLVRPALHWTEEEKEKYVHDFICENITYDKLKKPYSHEIIGPLGQGVGVCEGIAKAVKILCDALQVWCMIAICDNNPEKGIKYRHTWNIVRINGKYYHLDATFDNTLGKDREIRYDYFNLEDKAVFRDHEPAMTKVPACTDGDSFYYRKKKLSFTKVEDVYKRSLQAAKKGKSLVFHWRGGYLTKDMLLQLLAVIEQAGKEKEKLPRVSVNWAQKVLRVVYVPNDLAVEEEIVTEVANEGEA